MNLIVIPFINEVMAKHSNEKTANYKIKHSRFNEITKKKLHMLWNIDLSITMPKAMVDRQIQCSNMILSSSLGGKQSPVVMCEIYFIGTIAKLSVWNFYYLQQRFAAD